MNFVVKKHNKSEVFETYKKWCEQHGFPVMDIGLFPENAFMVYLQENNFDVSLYMIWFWHTDSKFAQIGFPVSNKNISKNKKAGALEFLLNEVSKYARRKKYMLLFTTSNTESVVDCLKKSGFVYGDQNVSQFLKRI
jgi:hypothetical protein